MNSHEWLDVVDEQDRVVGCASRAQVHAHQLLHRAVHILWFNTRGELYIQKRAPSKDTYPGRYDSSAAGHVAPGEDYDSAAARELAEELGLTHLQPQRLFKIHACPETGHEFVWVYRLTGDYLAQPNPHEIESARFWPLSELETALRLYPDQFAPSFIKVFDLYRQFR